MPLLTDRQEPEDFEPTPPDDPNEYALRYLYGANRPARLEWQRAGKVLLYSAIAANFMAFWLYAGWLEFSFVAWLLAMALLIIFVGGLVALWLRPRPKLALTLAFIPALITILTFAILLTGPQSSEAAYFAFFLPGSLTMAAASGVLLKSRTED